jgi:hypothetical protein
VKCGQLLENKVDIVIVLMDQEMGVGKMNGVQAAKEIKRISN